MRCSLYMYIFTHVYSQYSLQARQLLLKFPEYVNLLICTHTKGISPTPLGGMHMPNKLKKFFVLK